MRASARITCTAPTTPASRSAVSGSSGRSPAHSSTQSHRPGSAPQGRRSRRSSSNTTSASSDSGSRSSARSSKPAAPAASSTRANLRTGSSLARSRPGTSSTLEELERERRKLAGLERHRPEPLTAAERDALAKIARDLPRLWSAATTTHRDRKELLRTLITEITITVIEEPRRAAIEILWEGGARTELEIRLWRRGAKRTCTPEDTVDLIRRLAEHTLTRRSRRSSTSKGAGPAPACCSQTAREVSPPAERHPGGAATGPRQRDLHDQAGRRRARRDRDDDLPVAARGPAARRADHATRALANPSHARGASPVRARRPRRLPATGSRREAARVCASDGFA